MSMHMAGSDDDYAAIDLAQAEQNEILTAALLADTDLQRRRSELSAIRMIHRLTAAYNRSIYASRGIDVDAIPWAVTERQYRATLRMAAKFLQNDGNLTPEKVRHEWSVELAQEDALHELPPDVLTVFEDLPLNEQMAEQAATAAMRQAMRPDPIIEDYSQLDYDRLIYLAHACDNRLAQGELARRRALGAIQAA
ncbi:hypothetical protein [Pseudopelagicola sp. nBUS_19]|uniref:hypothetical protein n=1 Tax=Pseudopelagicola sp. nBUS_19 TaxID=3395316 RepID=UPI003EBDDF1D